MVASDEWETMYLTRDGWVQGGYHLDCGSARQDSRPDGAVRWVRRHVTVGQLGAPSSMRINETEGDLIDDPSEIKSLLALYGPPPFGV